MTKEQLKKLENSEIIKMPINKEELAYMHDFFIEETDNELFKEFEYDM